MSWREVKAVKRCATRIRNRLHSIDHDSNFVVDAFRYFGSVCQFPLFANLRAGEWYVDPSRIPVFDTCYFKSTDGHYGHWSFHVSRLNLHVARVAFQRQGAIIVDSTRKGKRFPDSMSRTIPIWAAVLSTIFSKRTDHHAALREYLHLPRWVSDLEITQIHKLLDDFHQKALEYVESLPDWRDSSVLDTPFRPLKCVYVNPDTVYDHMEFDTSRFPYVPLVCICASEPASPEDESYSPTQKSWVYVQGSGDDAETWSRGLTPRMFWTNWQRILSSLLPDDDFDLFIDEVVVEAEKSLAAENAQDQNADGTAAELFGFSLCASSFRRFCIGPASSVEYIPSFASSDVSRFLCVGDQDVISGALQRWRTRNDPNSLDSLLLLFPVPNVKKDRYTFQLLCPLIYKSLGSADSRKICVVCRDGRNASAALLVAFKLLENHALGITDADDQSQNEGALENSGAAEQEQEQEGEGNEFHGKSSIRKLVVLLQSYARHVCIGRNLMKQMNRLCMSSTFNSSVHPVMRRFRFADDGSQLVDCVQGSVIVFQTALFPVTDWERIITIGR
eukprot:ANDGO_03374.mRNA.1 Uncharacterized protein C3F10.06c